MPKAGTSVGSGITERVTVSFDWNTPGDFEAQLAAALELHDRGSFQRLKRRLTASATLILTQAQLPTDASRTYSVATDGSWTAAPIEIETGVELNDDSVLLDVAVSLCEFAYDTPEGYAASVLVLLRQAEEQLSAASLDEAMATAFNLGAVLTEASMKDVFEPGFMVGERVQAGGRKGHEQTHGTTPEKEAVWASYVQAFHAIRPEYNSAAKAYEAVAKRFGVEALTIRRAIGRQKFR